MKRLCRRRGCKSRHKDAVWLVDRVPYCNSCYQNFMENHFCDEHLIVRLSDNEYDFPERDYIHQRTTAIA